MQFPISHLFSLSYVLLPLMYTHTHTDAFTSTYNSQCYEPKGNRRINSAAPTRSINGRTLNSAVFSSTDDIVEEGFTNPDLIDQMAVAQKRETPKLTEEDKSWVQTLYKACDGNQEAMENAITADLDNMHPRLVVALQLAADKGEWKEGNDDEEFEQQMVALGSSLHNVLDTRLRSGRELLADLLNSGEIRKLDSMIGKAAKDGKLDMSFFSVLSMNMKDAAMSGDIISSPTLATGEGQEEVKGEAGQPMSANRLQILQHIYTRCQEELEKTVAPGIGLLNKVLRTEISSIRSNQLSHYLGPQATTITSPDGKTIDLGGTGKPLVSHIEFIEALSNAVNQIRTLEAAGGTDRLSAVNLIENIRQLAMEARAVLVESFGEGSEVVQEFQRELQPVFRPGSTVEN
ncbi:hypothetical protein HJC23_000213 [Cyclotella cryptica]|uniref:Uncharacterized protein n=1 Tax=Cyclotella cryptica TaxID=29204 RepID=A0ABD3QEC7_9STRA|eukprot:CCRYP_006405-RA/>CCRYP_006405-RA protein AED:0.26 eAED:0.21 QI:0/-1/0/1/-1/1/1/0/402